MTTPSQPNNKHKRRRNFMKRKYRYLKPNERIQITDWYNSRFNESSIKLDMTEPGWVQNDTEDWKIGKKANEIGPNLIIARYVGPVTPPRPYHSKTQATDLPDSTIE